MHLFRTTLSMTACLVLTASPCPVFANSYEWIPLNELPSASEIVAFSNRYARERDHQATLRQIQEVLQTGKRHSEFPKAGEPWSVTGKFYANGVFICRKGEAYFWAVWNERGLHIVDSKGRRCVVETFGEGIIPQADPTGTDEGVYLKLVPPAPDEVMWFFNDQAPATGASLDCDQEQVLRFLRKGKKRPCTSIEEEAELRKNTWLTLPADRASSQRRMRTDMKGDAIPRNLENQAAFQVKGILATSDGRIFFWDQWADHLLALRDEHGGLCVLELL